ncbi:hypothetical protein AAHB37_17295 [Glutamicibacter halophytocola]|uniref:hypothetical protein n=1 Tax=Glutamicibacter halophytocola TaxID=1933880 RepID=UPI00321B6950
MLRQDWYQASRGYLANIVAYAIAKFSLSIKQQFFGAELNFSSIWNNQEIGPETLTELVNLSRLAQIHLTDPSRPQGNVTQWAKQQACWERFKILPVKLGSLLQQELISQQEAKTQVAEARKVRAIDSSYETIQRVMEVDKAIWHVAIGSQPGLRISPTESTLVRKYGIPNNAVPSERQATAMLRVLARMEGLGIISSDQY